MRAAEMVRWPDRSERQGSEKPWHTLDCIETTGRSVSLRDGFLGRPIRLKKLVDPRRHLSSFGDGLYNQRGDELIPSHSSFSISLLGFNAPLA